MSDEDKNAPSAPTPPATPPLISRELRLRIVSGAAVAAVALLALWAGPVPFALLVFAVAAAMSWEWGRIVRQEGFDVPGVVHIASVGAAAVLSALGMAGLAVAAVAIGAIAVSALLFGGGQAKLSSLGVLYTGLPVVALVWLRGDASLGLLAVLFIVLAVAATDVAAYFTGRTVGGPKLAARISPGKTWSGLAGGVVAAAIAGGLLGLLTQRGNPAWMALLAFFLAFVAQGGDLAESALKRAYGIKDASDLIPGHGGFMDRMDGIVAAATVAALIALMIDAYAPARALLHGS
ncbi:MAG TPA: phosphatidate cytidylyltransferase [Hyphomicrobium sp.]|nr:phosphatidate cytidylyltransferase [Hyphomicrobium sp.]